MDRIDAVLPLVARDLPRAQILRTSLDRFFHDLGTCWIVVPDGDFHIIAHAIDGPRYRVIRESGITAEVAWYNTLRSMIHRQPMMGWRVQQLVKLAMADHVETDWYLTLDADVICTRPVRYADLIRDERGLSRRYKVHTPEQSEQYRKWYADAERVLGLTASGWAHTVTPALFHRGAIALLREHLHRRHWVGRLLGWRAFLIWQEPWTEYALYNTFLEARNLYERYHYDDGRRVCEGLPVWTAADYATWNPAKSFAHSSNHYFTLIQSSLNIPASTIWARVEPYLDPPRA